MKQFLTSVKSCKHCFIVRTNAPFNLASPTRSTSMSAAETSTRVSGSEAFGMVKAKSSFLMAPSTKASGTLAECMGKESLSRRKAKSMRDGGFMTVSTVSGCQSIRTVARTRVCGVEIRLTGLALKNGKMGPGFLAIIQTARSLVLASTCGGMVPRIKEDGRTGKSQGSAVTSGSTRKNSLANGLTARCQVSAFISGLMVSVTKASSRATSGRASASSRLPTPTPTA